MSDLVVIEKANVITVFTVDNQLDPILQKIANDVKSLIPDTTTVSGRKEIASMAYRVAQSKTYLDGLGKQLVDDYKELPKKIDANRKSMRDFLDNLKDEVRKPLTDWEAEQAKIEAERLAKEEAEKLAIKIENDHEIGLLLNAEFDRKIAEAKQLAEQQRLDHERVIAERAAEQARKQEQEKAEASRLESEKEAERLREIESNKLIQAKLEAERAKQAEAEAVRQAERAVEQERERIANEERALEAETLLRESDKEHKRKINNQAVESLMKIGLDRATSESVVKSVALNKITNISIKY